MASSGPNGRRQTAAAAANAAALAAAPAAGRTGRGVGRSGEHDPRLADRQTLQEMIMEVMTQVLLPFHAKFTIIEGLIGGRS